MDDTNIDSPDTAMQAAQSAYTQPNQTGTVGPDSSGGADQVSPISIRQRMENLISQKGAFTDQPSYMAAVSKQTRDYARETGVDLSSPEGQQWFTAHLDMAREAKNMGDFTRPPPDKKSAIILSKDQRAFDPTSHAVIGEGPKSEGEQAKAEDAAYGKLNALYRMKDEVATRAANAQVGDQTQLKTPADTAAWKNVYKDEFKNTTENGAGDLQAQKNDQAQQRIDEHVKTDGTKMTDGEKAQVKLANSDLNTAQKHFEDASKYSQKMGSVDADAKLLNGLRQDVATARAKRDALFEPQEESAPPVAPGSTTPTKPTAPGMDEPQPEASQLPPNQMDILTKWLAANPNHANAPTVRAILKKQGGS